MLARTDGSPSGVSKIDCFDQLGLLATGRGTSELLAFRGDPGGGDGGGGDGGGGDGGGGDGGGGDGGGGGGGDGDFALHVLGFFNSLASSVHTYKLLKASAPPKICTESVRAASSQVSKL